MTLQNMRTCDKKQFVAGRRHIMLLVVIGLFVRIDMDYTDKNWFKPDRNW
jgi:hypothetical protein